ncbi:MAG: glutamate-1-semialdehyde 2,1-aminomutase [Saprospiraceae bacterium]
MIRKKSEKLFEEAKIYFPGGVNSPVRAFKSVFGSPLFIKEAKGAIMIDEDDNKFIDFCCSWGPLILGHNDSGVKKEVVKAIRKGTSFGTPTKYGNALGKIIIENHSYLDKIRFVSSGTEAVMSAIRLARGFTGKDKIIKFEGCYHGHVDSLLVRAGSGLATFGESTSAGIPESFIKDTIVLDLNDLDGLKRTIEKKANNIACIIIEPIPANNGLLLQDHKYLIGLRKLCDNNGILLIFDEVISGFRIGFEGAAGHYSIEPDLMTFGKVIGGGFPVGAFGGKGHIMSSIAPEGPVYQAGTLSANPVAMAAGYEVLSRLLEKGFYEKLENKTVAFLSIVQEHISNMNYPVSLVQMGSIFWISFSTVKSIKASDINQKEMEHFKKLHGYLLNNGVYLGPSGYEVGFISSAHSSGILKKAATIICSGLDAVFGKLI